MNELRNKGQCVGSGKHHLFFSEKAEELAAAQGICHSCPVRLPCLRWAVENQAEWGVWGGVIFWDGRPYWRKRGRGRPPNSEPQHVLEMSERELALLVSSA